MSALIDILPDSILLEIFSSLSQKKLCHVALVCKHWRCLAYDGSLWRSVKIHRLKPYHLNSLTERRLGRQLKQVVLWRCSISNENLFYFAKACPHLQEIILRKNTLKLQRRNDLGKLCFPELRVLDARDLQGYVSHVLEMIAGAPKLEKLAIDGSMDGFFDYNVFRSTPELRTLDCSRCMDVLDEGVAFLAQECPKLESLSLMRCYMIEGMTLPLLFQRCRAIKSLSLAYTHVTDNVLMSCDFDKCCLEELDISHCPGVSSRSISYITSKLRNITYLNINSCNYGPHGIHRDILRNIACNKTLKVLNIDAVDGQDGADRDFVKISQHCKSLEVLRVNKAFATLAGLQQCLRNLPFLKRFGIVNYRRDHLDTGLEVQYVLQALATFSPKLEILELSDFLDKETSEKIEAFYRLMIRCAGLRKISIFTLNRDIFVMAAQARMRAIRSDIRLVQPTMICPTPRVVTTLPHRSFDQVVYSDTDKRIQDDDDPWIARKYY
ncbi:F-box/LRR-repeat protein 20-like [Exaiptasia diaphana]|uniref:F-box domain-containing protein n=1 Tax=Exaiptasia diaphana TaxID=2652724 RepID=A0A913Y561_EXADI|nr:F-box/LRR-repeat protein 20-like [Exaiptasia diaphana]